MPLFSDQSAFEDFKKKFQEKTQQSRFDSRYLSMEAGKTYKMRLLFWQNPNSTRKGPFIERWMHSVKNDEGTWEHVVCPTTLQPKAGFNRCPVCNQNSKFWKSGTEADKKLYDTYKRKFRGHALVYVVNDPTNPDNNGHVRILKYSITMSKWLNAQIFGIRDTKGDDAPVVKEEDIIGYDCFKLENGFDLVIETIKKGEYIDYQPSFSRKASSLTIDEAVLETELASLGFDNEPMSTSDEELQQFFRRNVLDTIDASGETTSKVEARPAHPPFPPAESKSNPAEKTIESKDKTIAQVVPLAEKTTGPTSDPTVAGQLYVTAGALMVSAG